MIIFWFLFYKTLGPTKIIKKHKKKHTHAWKAKLHKVSEMLIIVCKNGLHDIGTLIYFNGGVYMFGGTNCVSSKVEFLYPFKNSSFTTSQDSQSLQNNRGAMSSVVLPNGLIYLIAGLAGGRVNRVSPFLSF